MSINNEKQRVRGGNKPRLFSSLLNSRSNLRFLTLTEKTIIVYSHKKCVSIGLVRNIFILFVMSIRKCFKKFIQNKFWILEELFEYFENIMVLVLFRRCRPIIAVTAALILNAIISCYQYVDHHTLY